MCLNSTYLEILLAYAAELFFALPFPVPDMW